MAVIRSLRDGHLGLTETSAKSAAAKFMRGHNPFKQNFSNLHEQVITRRYDLQTIADLLSEAQSSEWFPIGVSPSVGHLVDAERRLGVALTRLTKARNEMLAIKRKDDEYDTTAGDLKTEQLVTGLRHIHEVVPSVKMGVTQNGLIFYLHTIEHTYDGQTYLFPGIVLEIHYAHLKIVVRPHTGEEVPGFPCVNTDDEGDNYHPHVFREGNRLCLGDVSSEMEHHQAEGHVYEIAELAMKLLAKYNNRSPVTDITEWKTGHCDSCGGMSDTFYECEDEDCEYTGCSDCMMLTDVGNWVCEDHYEDCPCCLRSLMRSQMKICVSCDRRLCIDCCPSHSAICNECGKACGVCGKFVDRGTLKQCGECEFDLCEECFGEISTYLCATCYEERSVGQEANNYNGVPAEGQRELPFASQNVEESPTLMAIFNQLM